MFKYLGDYLSRDFSPAQRTSAIRAHYQVTRQLGIDRPALLPRSIWLKRNGPQHPPSVIYLNRARLAPLEGELELSFHFDARLFTLTFIFAPRHAVESEHPLVLFIGGIQGRPGARSEIRLAAKLNGEISPAAMLVLAARELARLAGAGELVAVDACGQIAMSYAAEQIRLDYDKFWVEAGGVKRNSLYHLPVTPRSSLLADIPRSHRSRTRRKRDLKARQSEEIARALRLYGPRAPEARSTALDPAATG